MARRGNGWSGAHIMSGHGLLEKIRAKYEEECWDLIMSTLKKHDYVKNKAAEELGINRTTLVEWCRRHAPKLLEEKK